MISVPVVRCEGSSITCDDGDGCTNDTCDPRDGMRVYIDSRAASVMRTVTAPIIMCARVPRPVWGSLCKPGVPLACNDGNVLHQ